MKLIKGFEDAQGVTANIMAKTAKYVEKNNIKSLVLGISGGIDSCVVACLAREVCDITGIPLIGISMPHNTNKEDERNRAMAISGLLCDQSVRIPIDTTVIAFRGLSPVFREGSTNEEKIRIGNIQARIRMTILYHYAHMNKGIVLSTDNYTEYLLGFWTLHGDVGDFGMIQNLFKTEVYEIARFYRFLYKDVSFWIDACIQATPTDGLGITDSDLDQIGVDSYEEVDDILIKMEDGYPVDSENPVVKMREKTHFKRDNPYNLDRTDIVK